MWGVLCGVCRVRNFLLQLKRGFLSPLLWVLFPPATSRPSLAPGLEARRRGLVLAQTVPLGHGLAGALAHLSPVFGTAGGDTVRPQDQPAHHLVLGGAIEVDDQELDADVGQEVSGDVVDERLVEDWVQSALLHVGFLLGNALSAVVDVHLDIRIWGPQRKKGDRPMTLSSPIQCQGGGASALHPLDVPSLTPCGLW